MSDSPRRPRGDSYASLARPHAPRRLCLPATRQRPTDGSGRWLTSSGSDAVTDPDRIKLLFGPYRSPSLRRGDRAYCLFRDCLVVITSWTDAPIPWPRCRVLDGPGGGSGLLVDGELARAVCHESAAAVCHWWGTCQGAVKRWRKALDVTRTNNEGSQRLIHTAADLGGEALAARGLTPEEIEQRRVQARNMNLSQYLPKGYHGPWWTDEEIALLGTMADEQVAKKVNRPVQAVRQKRERMGISNPTHSPRVGPRPRWTSEEDQLAPTLSIQETAQQTGRTENAVRNRRHILASSRSEVLSDGPH